MTDRRRSSSQRGSVLVLVPTLALVAVALAGIATDLVAVHSAQRRTQAVIASAADDAAGMLDTRRIQLDAAAVVDPVVARRTVEAHVRTATLPGRLRHLEVVARPDRVDVLARLEVDRIVLRALPGTARTTTVEARSSARVTP